MATIGTGYYDDHGVGDLGDHDDDNDGDGDNENKFFPCLPS